MLHRRMRGRDDAVRGEAELLEQDVAFGARAEVVDGHDLAGFADPLAPALLDGRLDADARLDLGRQDLLPVRVGLVLEPLHARHRHHAGGRAFGLEALARLQRQLDLRAGCDEDHLGPPGGSLFQDVAALTGVRDLDRVEDPEVLPRKCDAGGTVGGLEDLAPAHRRLVRVGRADDIEAGDRAQRGELLDRLVGRSVAAEPDRVVRPDEDRRQLHERREPYRRTHVVAEHEERPAVHAGAAVQRDAVDDGAHRVLADAEVQRASVRPAGPHLGLVLGRDEAGLALHRGVVALGEVGRTAPQFRQHRCELRQHLAGRLAGRDAVRLAVLLRRPRRQRRRPPVRQCAVLHPLVQRGRVRVVLCPPVEVLLPLGVVGPAAVDDRAGVVEHALGHGEGDVGVEAEDLLRLLDLVDAECRRRAPCRCSAAWARASR